MTYEDGTEEQEIKSRVMSTVELSQNSDFIKFEILLNEIPVGKFVGQRNSTEILAETEYERGKDVVIDWEFLDGFDSDNNLWIDSNGLDMVSKKLWERKEFQAKKTNNVASNFYPVTSAIAIRDKNS